jgi:hypothetical protein
MFFKATRQNLRLNHSLIKEVDEILSSWVKSAGRSADLFLASKNSRRSASTPSYVWKVRCLFKHTDKS